VPKNNVETLYSGTKVGNASLVHMVSMIAAIDVIVAISWKPLSSERSHRSDRSDNDHCESKSYISEIIVAAIAGRVVSI